MAGERQILNLREQARLEAKRAERRDTVVGVSIAGIILAVFIVVGAGFCSMGCSSLIPPTTTPTQQCQTYDDDFVVWSAMGIASGSLSGAAGASGILSATLGDTPEADAALAASSAVLGALAAVASWAAAHYAGRFAEDCHDPPSTAPVPP